MPKKPHKYGIKVMCLADAKTSYLYNVYIYAGKDSDGIGFSQEDLTNKIPTQSAIKLCKPVEQTNHNVTDDNWFASLKVTDDLENMRPTYVGTLKKTKNKIKTKNIKEIPAEFLPNKNQ